MAIINRATFYAHFEDKFKLLEYMVREAFQEKLESKIESCEGLTSENLRLLMLTTCEFLAAFDDEFAPRTGNDHPPIERQIQPFVYEVLLRWATLSAVASAEITAMTISWAMFGSALQWSRGKREMSADLLTENVISLLTTDKLNA